VPARFAGNLRRLLVGCVALALALGVSLFFLLRPPAGRDGAAGAHSGSEVSHHFTRSYTGVVWLRITPAGSDAATDLRVRLRWGRFENSFAVKQLASGSRTFTLQKNDRDDVTFLVRVEPRARVDFGEGKPPDRGAQEVPSGWRKRTSG
jgi:hypothetical protein